MLLDVYRSELVFFDSLLADDDGVLEVVALPAHEGHQDVLPQRQFTLTGRRAVGEDLTVPNLVSLPDDRALVDARALVAP